MTLSLLLALLGAATQTDALFTNTPPANVPTFEVSMRGSEPFYAAVRIGGQWLMEHSKEIPQNQELEIVPDAPNYHHGSLRAHRMSVKLRYEAPAMRRSRLEQQWKSQGYDFLETSAGWQPVKIEEMELSNRAREMVQAAAQKKSATTSAQQAAEGAAPENKGLGLLIVGRSVVLLVGVALIGLVVKATLRREKEWTSLE